MLNQILNILVLSDIHLGHRKTPTEHIIDNIKRVIPDTVESDKLDMIIIPGDLFDRFLNLPQDDTYSIHGLIGYLLSLCKRRDIVLRVLEGTPSHDWKQPRLIDEINVIVGADAKHIPILSIEHIKRFNIDILYIPDEWSHDNDDTWNQVQSLLQEHQLEKVDFTVMHGQFAYQLPSHVDVPVHIPERYAGITRHYVFCGHVHKPSTYLNIIVPGSFDRLTHGEEEAKGAWRITVNPNGDDSIVFCENKGAQIYQTIDCSGLSTSDAIETVDKIVSGYPPGSRLRIMAKDTDPIGSSLEVLIKRYPTFHFDPLRNTKTKSAKETLVDMRATFRTTPITKESIASLLAEELLRLGIDQDQHARYLDRLKEVI